MTVRSATPDVESESSPLNETVPEIGVGGTGGFDELIDTAGGTVSTFQTGDALVATADDASHQLTVTRNGAVVKTIPMSMGMTAGGHQTPNGSYYVQEKMPSVVMDSSTYGVPVNSTYGYRTTVELAVRFDDSGGVSHRFSAGETHPARRP